MIINFLNSKFINNNFLPLGKEGIKIGLTSGVFDLFHYYHLVYLEKCRRYCDFLIVGIDSDRLVKEVKGNSRPIFPERHRVEIIDSLKLVDLSFIMDKIEDFRFIAEFFNVNLIFKNQAFSEEKILKNKDSEIVIIPDIEELTSTTEFINKIKKEIKE